MRQREQSSENAVAAQRQSGGREDQATLLRLQQGAGNAAVARLVAASRSLQRQPLELDQHTGAIWHHILPPGHTLEGTLNGPMGSGHATFTLDAGAELLAKHGRVIP
jgi:hypothetical protein